MANTVVGVAGTTKTFLIEDLLDGDDPIISIGVDEDVTYSIINMDGELISSGDLAYVDGRWAVNADLPSVPGRYYVVFTVALSDANEEWTVRIEVDARKVDL